MTVRDAATYPNDEHGALCRALSILLVEDSRSNRRIITVLLRKRGHRVTSFESGREALKKFASRRFDAVLMDIEMPAMNGYQTAAAMRRKERPSNSHTPIIALSAHASGAGRQDWLKVGMDAYMTKPVDIDQLILVIKNMMPGPRGCGGSDGVQKPLAKDDSSLGPFIEAIDFAATMPRLDHDVELFQDIIEIFDEDSPRLLKAIESAMANNDANAIRRAAHALRGLAANFEAASLVETARFLEHANRDELFLRNAALPSKIAVEVAQVRAALAEHRLPRPVYPGSVPDVSSISALDDGPG